MNYIQGIDGKFYSINQGQIVEIQNPYLDYHFRQRYCIDCLKLTSGNCGRHFEGSFSLWERNKSH